MRFPWTFMMHISHVCFMDQNRQKAPLCSFRKELCWLLIIALQCLISLFALFVSPHQAVLPRPSKALPKMASCSKSEQSAAVCPSPNHAAAAGLAWGNGKQAFPAPAGVSPGVDKTGAECLPQGWKDVGWEQEKELALQYCRFQHF